jgi:hypothetical protein
MALPPLVMRLTDYARASIPIIDATSVSPVVCYRILGDLALNCPPLCGAMVCPCARGKAVAMSLRGVAYLISPDKVSLMPQ